MLLISCIILIFAVILLNHIPIKNLEQFKNNQTYKPVYLNDPKKMIKYHGKRNLTNYVAPDNDCDIIVNPIYHNVDDEMIQLRKNRDNILETREIRPRQHRKYCVEASSVSPPDDIDKFNTHASLAKQKCFTEVKKVSRTSNHKLYADALFTFEPAKKIISNDHPTIDQTISLNIINYVEQGIESVPDNHSMNGCKINNMQGKTIKQIYDDITNDNRFEFQQNLDDVEANNMRNDFIIGEKYGATRFDTYSVQTSN